MALPKYLYIKLNDRVHVVHLESEDSDCYYVVIPSFPGMKYHYKKTDPQIIGSGDGPYVLPNGSVVQPIILSINANEIFQKLSTGGPTGPMGPWGQGPNS